jgi:phage tail sheath protein FI
VTKAAAAATSAEYVTAIGKIFNRYMPKGFLIAPQAFELLTTQADRTAVANTMRDTSATYNLLALTDSGPSTGTGAVDTFAKTQTEVALYTSERGHLAYYAGYIKDTTNRTIPTSPFIAGIANRRYRQEGFNQPPAGAKYQLRGAVDTLIQWTDSDQEVLNPLGCNLVRNLYGLGVICWGARTRSTEKRTQFVHERVILNVLETTLQSAFDADLFTSIGSSGELLLRVQETITSICYRLWKGGALFGIAPTDAYAVLCDMKNNLLPDLQNGIVVADVYVAITPIMERLFITVKPTAVGQVSLVVALVTGDGNEKDKKATEPKESSASK